MRIEELRLETEAFCCKNCMNDMEFELILIKVQRQSRIESSHSYQLQRISKANITKGGKSRGMVKGAI